MKKLVIFDDWEIDHDAPFGSGASRKHWLINKHKNKRGIFKYPKKTSSGIFTGEYWAESLACEIARALNIPCAEVDMGYFNGELGSMSYMIVGQDEILVDGISFITEKYPNYSIDDFYDETLNSWYTIQMILNSLKDINLDKDFLKIPIFDCLIGNSDRHHNNWGVIINADTNKKLSPLYDNGSSLCSIVPENKINLKDKHWLNAQIDTKSKSIIRFENKQMKPTHFEILKYIAKNHYEDTIGLICHIKDVLTEANINKLIECYPNEVIYPKIKMLLKIYLSEKINKIVDIYQERK